MQEQKDRILWKYDANQEGILTGTFFAELEEVSGVDGIAIEHAEFGTFIVEADDFSIIAEDLAGPEDSELIDAMVAKDIAVIGFNPILWIEVAQCAKSEDDEWVVASPDKDDEDTVVHWSTPDEDEVFDEDSEID